MDLPYLRWMKLDTFCGYREGASEDMPPRMLAGELRRCQKWAVAADTLSVE